jgi:hypothetical protein
LHIRLALHARTRHGYDIMQQVREDPGAAKMGPGSPGSLDRMIAAGLVFNSNTRDPWIYYKLTGNITGVTNAYDSVGGKCLQLLKEAAPLGERVGVIQNSTSGTTRSYFPQWSSGRPRFGRDPHGICRRRDLTRKTDAFATQPNGGPFVNSVTAANRENRETRPASCASPPPLE